MNNPFRRTRAVADPTSLEAGVRDILASLRANTDQDCANVLASATNTFYSALVTFRGNTAFGPDDVLAMFSIWETLLNVGRARTSNVSEYAPRGRAIEPEVEDETNNDEGAR